MSINIEHYTSELFKDNSIDQGMLVPKFPELEPKTFQHNIQHISEVLITDFAEKNNLIVPGFVYNILSIYRNYTRTENLVEVRGIIQLYTVYFVLSFISAYWTPIMKATEDFITHKIFENLRIHPKPNIVIPDNVEDNSTVDNMRHIYNLGIKLLKEILDPLNKFSDIGIPASIKDFLFKHPVNVDWKLYDVTLFYSLIVIIVIYNYVYFLKTLSQTKNKPFVNKLQKKLNSRKRNSTEVNIKYVGQLFMFYGFMRQHMSTEPYGKEFNINNTLKKQKKTNNNRKKSMFNNQNNINTISNNLSGLNRPNNTNTNTTPKQTMGSQLLLEKIIKLMHLQPFPYDPKLLRKFKKGMSLQEQQQKSYNGKTVTIRLDGSNAEVEKLSGFSQVMTEQDKGMGKMISELASLTSGVAKTATQIGKQVKSEGLISTVAQASSNSIAGKGAQQLINTRNKYAPKKEIKEINGTSGTSNA